MGEKIYFGTYHLFNDKNKDLSLINKAISIGYRNFDTAQVYGDGYSEEVLGTAIKSSGIDRKEFKLMTKVSPKNLSYKDTIKSTIQSAKRLGTYIDYLLIHVPNNQFTLSETFGAMKKLKERKIIKEYGVSNFPIDLLAKAKQFGITAVQEEYSLIYLHNLKQLRFSKKNGLKFFAYMPLSNGFLLKGNNLKNLEPLSKKYDKTPAQVALKWVQQSGAIAVVGSKKESHLKNNLKNNWFLTKDDFLALAKKNWTPMD